MKYKKGIYFTLMTVAFLVIFIFVFMVPYYKTATQKMSSTEMRIDSMNDFIKDIERDTQRGLYISSFRGIMALEGNMISKGKFLHDVKSSFKEAVINGSINGTNMTIMKSSKFPEWIQNIKNKANGLNIQLNMTLNNLEVYQSDPWHVAVSANLTYYLKDVTNIASWNITKVITSEISIIGFEDPLYIVYTYGRTTNLINKTTFENNFTYMVNGKWNTTNLVNHVLDGYYIANPNAPNFLMRFENNLNPSPDRNGIENLVNIKKLSDLGFDINTKSSMVDYYYWNDASNNGNYRINFTPEWFKLDDAHRALYNVTQVSYTE